MDTNLLRQAARLFEQAVDLDGAARSSFIELKCDGDAALRALVEELLAAHSSGAADDPLSPPLLDVPELADALSAEGGTPVRIGHYRIVRLIAEGGMGAVYEARQDSPSRSVALKLLRTSLPTRELLTRFRREGELLGSLRHPGIAAVHEAGVAPVEIAAGAGDVEGEAGDGDEDVRLVGVGAPQPFLAMELVQGPTLLEWSRRLDVSQRDRIELMAQVCDAVEHAHQRGIVHRDLKPTNIMLEEPGSALLRSVEADRPRQPPSQSLAARESGVRRPLPHPKVLDFGIARITDPDGGTLTLETEPGRILGTLAYMSPEQAAGDVSAVDRRTDIYALGAILYELLCGSQPLEVANRPIAEAVRIIRDEEPTRLASRTTTCRGDLDTIVARAMAKDPSRRYRTAADLADDLRRYLRNEPILARPPSVMYRARKFARRHRGLVTAVAMVFCVLVAGIVATTTLAVRAMAAEARATEYANELELVSDFQASQLAEIDAALMGGRIRGNIIEGRRAALRSTNHEEGDIQGALRELERALEGVNFTNIALRALEDSVVERALRVAEGTFEDRPRIKARLLQALADTLRELGLLESAMAPQTTALDIRRSIFGKEHPSTLQSVASIGVLLQLQGKLEDAELYHREALEGRRRTLGDEHPDTLSAIDNLGYLLFRRRELEDAGNYLLEALEGRRRILGDDHPDTLHSFNNMAPLLWEQGKRSDAEQHYRTALEGRRLALGNEHPDTLQSLNNVGTVLLRQENFEEAELYYREALATRRRVLGDEHPSTLVSINNMGALFLSQWKLDAAEPYYREALETCRRVLGSEHSTTLISINNMGSLLARQERLEDAESFYQEALETRRRVLDPEHPDTLTSANSLGDLLRRQRRFDEAEPLIREALDVRGRMFGGEHSDTLASVNCMGMLLRDQGRLEEAEEFGARAAGIARRVRPRHWETGEYLAQHARTLVALGRFADAEEQALEAHAIVEAALPGHKRTLDMIRQIADLYAAWHAAEPGGEYDRKAAEWRARLDPELKEVGGS